LRDKLFQHVSSRLHRYHRETKEGS
jgi:hypothetical protein